MSAMFRIVIDTNVLRAALWSSRGSSFCLVSKLPLSNITVLLSVPLYFEYREVLASPTNLPPGVSATQLHGFLRRFAAFAEPREIIFFGVHGFTIATTTWCWSWLLPELQRTSSPSTRGISTALNRHSAFTW
jgi:hypothetical protein